jgi:peptidase inhibitor family I36
MMSRKTVIGVIALCCLCRAEAASAQPRWGRERVPSAGACFYEDTNFHGRYFCVRQGDRLRSLPSGMSDKISSVRVMGSDVTVFRDSDMRGRSARFIGDVRNLKQEGWNDQISSVEVGRGGDRGRWRGDRSPVWGRDEPMPREGACFYQDSDFRGPYFCAPRGATYTSLPRGFNDRISSIRVFGADVRLFQNQKFGGRSTEIRSDVPNLRGHWSDNVSSIRVF